MPIQLHRVNVPPPALEAKERPRDRKLRGLPRFLVAVLIVVIVVGLVYTVLTWGKLQVKGRVVAAYTELVPRARCRVTKVNTQVGEAVSRGKLLVETESVDPLSQIPTFQAALAAAQARYDLVKGGADVGEADLDSRQRRLLQAQQAHEVAVARLQQAQAAQKNYEELVNLAKSDMDKEITKAGNDVDVARQRLVSAQASEKEAAVDLETARRNWERAQVLFDLDAATRRDLDTAKDKFDFASATMEKGRAGSQEGQTSLTAAQAVLVSIKTKTAADVAASQSRLAEAKASTTEAETWEKTSASDLAAAQKQYGGAASEPDALRKRELDLMQDRVSEARGNLDYYRGLAGTLEFVAPFNGIVGAINKKEGDVADALEVIISVYNVDTIYIEAFVPEENYKDVVDAKQAYVRVPGAGARFYGNIQDVSRKPTKLPGELKAPIREGEYARRYVSVRIEVADPEIRKLITPDMTAQVTIYTH